MGAVESDSVKSASKAKNKLHKAFISGGRGERERKLRLDTPASFLCREECRSMANKSRVWIVS